ncbi:MAG: NfeD family protein [Cyanobacteria bacterium P01_G01_bin.54]
MFNLDQFNISGTVEKVIGPGPSRRGQIRFQGGWWTARCELPNVILHPEQLCQVVGRKGITLLVVPLGSMA